jgi:hypothetical protein
MLRRTPTSITLTQDDITRYEEARKKRLLAQQQAEASSGVFMSGKGTEQGTVTAQGGRSKEDRIMGAGGGR